ncbi:MAG: hypothetical protein JSV17_01020 [Candidatus Aminicenantes bacterium]|nr:MAG: hypothetical protein JSV17_01020 [Candidatus Aminicenantes bacterium]
MKNFKSVCVVVLAIILISVGCSINRSEEKFSEQFISHLRQEFDLGRERSPEKQYYSIETKLVHYALDGKRSSVGTLFLHLETIPGSISGKNENEYVCRKFTVQRGTDSSTSIPDLEGWSYSYRFGLDDQGQVFGIDHNRFENLKNSDGQPFPPDTSYFVYNTFIDFHGFCDVFANRIEEGKGIQDLIALGDKIVHAAAFTEPPVNLGSNVAEGSTFQNGEVTLELKGLSLVHDRPSYVVEFDSGESSFNMIMQPMPNLQVETTGSSHYKGDLYIDMESHWVRKVVMWELVVSETSLPVAPHKVNSVIERTTIIQNLNQTEFLEGLEKIVN